MSEKPRFFENKENKVDKFYIPKYLRGYNGNCREKVKKRAKNKFKNPRIKQYRRLDDKVQEIGSYIYMKEERLRKYQVFIKLFEDLSKSLRLAQQKLSSGTDQSIKDLNLSLKENLPPACYFIGIIASENISRVIDEPCIKACNEACKLVEKMEQIYEEHEKAKSDAGGELDPLHYEHFIQSQIDLIEKLPIEDLKREPESLRSKIKLLKEQKQKAEEDRHRFVQESPGLLKKVCEAWAFWAKPVYDEEEFIGTYERMLEAFKSKVLNKDVGSPKITYCDMVMFFYMRWNGEGGYRRHYQKENLPSLQLRNLCKDGSRLKMDMVEDLQKMEMEKELLERHKDETVIQMLESKSSKQVIKPDFTKVDQLCPGTTGHTLTVKVLTTKKVVQKGCVDGPKLQIAECLVGDETAMIIFIARNDDVELMKKDAILYVYNAKVEVIRGSMRLAVDEQGYIKNVVESVDDIDVNRSNNLSLIEFEEFVVVED